MLFKVRYMLLAHPVIESLLGFHALLPICISLDISNSQFVDWAVGGHESKVNQLLQSCWVLQVIA